MATKRMPTGLVIRDRSIKIWFMYQGKRCWESLPLKPTTANIRHATKLREEICTRIAIGVFDYAEFFPNSKRAEETERSPTFREMASSPARVLYWIRSIGIVANFGQDVAVEHAAIAG